MAWTAERTTVNQKIQIGAEATTALGTAVAANKLLQNYDFTFGIIPDVIFYRPTGRKYDTVQIENAEWVDGTMAGTLDYNTSIYPLSGAMGSVSAVAHLASATAKDWIFNPPVTGSVVPQTYTFQQGDSIRAHQLAYGLFTQFGYKGDRKTFTVSGKVLAQAITDGATLTGSPTAVALAPVAAKQVNVYLDSTSGGLGTTLLTRVLAIDFTMDGIYGPLMTLNRANLGYAAHVDMAPKATFKLKVEADAAGMALLGYLQSGVTYFLQVDAQGAQIASDGPGAILNEFKHQMAVKVGKPTTFSDDQGVFAIEWELTIVEDSTWGHSQLLTVTNLLTAL
jgi:hypothetical protein